MSDDDDDDGFFWRKLTCNDMKTSVLHGGEEGKDCARFGHFGGICTYFMLLLDGGWWLMG